MKRALALSLIAIMSASTLTGCKQQENYRDIPLVPELSLSEVRDYYKASLQYDSIATRSTKPNEVSYEMTEVTDAMRDKLMAEIGKVEGLLARNDVSAKEMNKNIHRYMKYVLDDKTLTRKTDAKPIAQEALGHYFIDVQYNIAPKATGSFKNEIRYFGINGGFAEDMDGKVTVDLNFMEQADKSVAKYKEAHPDLEGKKYGATNYGVRTPKIDAELFNKASGMSLTQTAMMPDLGMIYNIPEASGSISGFGVYPEGGFALKAFDYDRAKMKGTATIRYVFKQELMDPSKIEFVNCYVTGYSLENKPKIDEDAIVPEFVEEEASKLLERSDRAIINNDLPALMNGKIYEDTGVAVLNGNMREYSNKQKHMSKIVDVVGRDKEGKMFMVEFETTEQSGAKDSSTMGTYVYSGYMVIQQVGTEFHITDYVITNYEMRKEPQIDVDSTILKRLAALNLTGEVQDEAKKGIGALMSKLYRASSERKLSEMYSCYNTDINLLSSTRREYLNSQLRSLLVKNGVKVPANYLGTIEQWIGGADNQVEFITNEIVDYHTLGQGVYMRNYYLVSRYDTEWVIDEMKIIESKDVIGEEYAAVRDKIASGTSVLIEGADNKAKEESEQQAQQETQPAQQEQAGQSESPTQPAPTEQPQTQPQTNQTQPQTNQANPGAVQQKLTETADKIEEGASQVAQSVDIVSDEGWE